MPVENDISLRELIDLPDEEVLKGIEVLTEYIYRCKRLRDEIKKRLKNTKVQDVERESARKMYNNCIESAIHLKVSYIHEALCRGFLYQDKKPAS